MQGWRVNLTVKLQRARGLERPYPIKLFYSQHAHILQTAFVSNTYFVSQMLYKQSPNPPFIILREERATRVEDASLVLSAPRIEDSNKSNRYTKTTTTTTGDGQSTHHRFDTKASRIQAGVRGRRWGG